MAPAYAAKHDAMPLQYQGRGINSLDDRIVDNVLRDQNRNLTTALQARFTNNLPTYAEFKNQFQEAYMHNNVSNLLREKQQFTQRPDLEKLPDMVESVAERSGYTSRQLRRLRNDNQYIDNLVSSLKPDTPFTLKEVQDQSTTVRGILEYRQIKSDYLVNDPFQRKLDIIVNNVKPSGNDLTDLNKTARTLKQQDIAMQLQSAPLQARLYERIDSILETASDENDMRSAYRKAEQEYLKLVAESASYDKARIRATLYGKEENAPSTSVGRVYERAGMDFNDLQKAFEIKQSEEGEDTLKEQAPKKDNIIKFPDI